MSRDFKKSGIVAVSVICLALGSTGMAWAGPDGQNGPGGPDGQNAPAHSHEAHDGKPEHGGSPHHGDDKHHHDSYRAGDHAPPGLQKRVHDVSYKKHHLHKPPKGYHWVRDPDTGQFLLIAVATGVIASIVAAHH